MKLIIAEIGQEMHDEIKRISYEKKMKIKDIVREALKAYIKGK